MNKTLLILAVLLAAAAATAAFAWRSSLRSAAENKALQAEIAALKTDLEQARAQSDRKDNVASEDQAQKIELMRLRNEVTQLRAANDAAAKASAENERLAQENKQLRTAASQAPGENAAAPTITRAQWAYLGNNTPENALVSAMWAIRDGRLDTYLNSISSEERQRIEPTLQQLSPADMVARQQKELAPVTGIRVLGRQEASPTEVVMEVFLEGANRVEKVRMSQVGQEWKYGGVVPQQAYDPYAFYRKNPELMRRYFPHLATQEGQAQPQAQPVVAPPQPQ